MDNNLVAYKNEMNLVPMRNFNSVEMDLFFSICSKMKDKKLNLIEFSFEELKNLSDYKPTAKNRFADDIESVYKKLLSLQFHKKNNNNRVGFVLFSSYNIDLEKEIVKIKTNPDFEYILNELSKEFTKFELEEFTELKSSYSKTAYRQLKQFRKTGYTIFEINDFRSLFCVPASYRLTDITKVILQPIKKELAVYFKNLEINKISKGKGRKITHIEFIFDKQNDLNDYGSSTFRDKDGFYYNSNIMNFTDEEVSKEFLNSPEPMSERYDEEKLKQKEEMKKNWLKLFPEDKNIFDK